MPTSTTSYVNAGGAPEYVTSTTGVAQFLTQDGRGNVATGVSSLTDVPCRLRFDPFGSPIGAQAHDNPCSTGSTPSSVLFAGARRDAGTGNYQAGGRTYSPGKAGFLTADTYRAGSPVRNLSVGVDPLTANRYAFVNGDPVNFGDPDGHEPKLINGSWSGFGCAEGICSMAAVYARDVDRIERAKHGQQVEAGKPGPACSGFLGCVGHIGGSFLEGAKDGFVGLGQGAVAVADLAVSAVTLPGDVAVALSRGDLDGAVGRVRAHGGKVKEAVVGTVNGLAGSARAANPVATIADTVSNVRKHGLGDGLARTAYSQGQLVPDAVLTLATMGAGKGLSKLRGPRPSATLMSQGASPGATPNMAHPSALTRTEALSGNASSRLVRDMAEDMRAHGWNSGSKIEVVSIEGRLYIVDGHHRLAAARRAGIDVQYEIVETSSVIRPGGWSSVDEIVDAALSIGPDRLRP